MKDCIRVVAITVIFTICLGASAGPGIDNPPTGRVPRVAPQKPAHTSIPAGASRERLHLKLMEGTAARLRGGRFISLADDDLAELQRVLDGYPGTRIQRLFSRPEEVLDAEKMRIEARSRRGQADLNLYYRLTVRPGADAARLIDDLNALVVVELAYPEPLPMPVPARRNAEAPSTTPNFQDQQYYMNPAPVGIEAFFAWTQPRGRGEGVKIVDVEYSWNQNHEDLSKALTAMVPNGTPVDPFSDNNHGTAVLGEMIADDNGFGVTGIAPGASIRLVNSYNSQFGYDLANAINLAHAAVGNGDILLIEQQAAGPLGCDAETQFGCVPVEWVLAYYDVIVLATSDGVIVVEPAGNGSQNLDDAVYGSPFPAGRPDSGAIMVGAGGADVSCFGTPARARLDFSNHGSRLDVQGWGECVVTTGYGDLQLGATPDSNYAGDFGGTSGASPIVSGAAAALSGIWQGRGILLESVQMREALRTTGRPQDLTTPGVLPGKIGPLPDLKKALDLPLAPFAGWRGYGDQGQPGAAGRGYGYSVSSAGDINGDGFADVIIGAPYYENGQVDEGIVWVYLGSSTGLSSAPAWTAEGDQNDAHLGFAVSSAGDVNKDGFDDIIVGAPGRSGGGQAFVWYGSAAGLGAPGTPGNADWIATGAVMTGGFSSLMGSAVASAGDVNGDTYDDIIIGAPGYDGGAAFVWHGGAGGPVPGGGNPNNRNWRALSLQGMANFGGTVASAGDVDGDGFDDIIIGAPDFTHGASQGSEGGAFLWLGSALGLGADGSISNDGASTNADWRAESNASGAKMGTSVAAGDFNHDGKSDLIIGAPGYSVTLNEGCVFGWYGGSGGLGSDGLPGNDDWRTCGANTGDGEGTSISALDANGDSFADALIGAHAGGNSEPGRACAFLGSPLGIATQPAWCMSNEQDNGRFGWPVASAGDVNGDSLDDTLVGDASYDVPAANVGSAYLYYGMPSIVDADGDGLAPSQGDCDDTNALAWLTPTEARNLRVTHNAVSGSTADLCWQEPQARGAVSVQYDAIRATTANGFETPGSASCVESGGADLCSADAEVPLTAKTFYYLIRAKNACPLSRGFGPLGSGSNGVLRKGRSCP